MIDKLDLLNDNSLLKVQGEWCKGCPADSEFKKQISNKGHVARLEFEEFFKNVNAVTTETIRVIKEEMRKIRAAFGSTDEIR